MKKIEKFFCPNCGTKNDTDMSWINTLHNSEWIYATGYEICWYCKKEFDWKIKNEYYIKK